MHSAEVRPGIVSARLDRVEQAIFSAEAKSMQSDLPHLREADFLDEVQERANVLRGRLSHVADFLGDMSTHKGMKVAVFDMGEDSLDGVTDTPTTYKIDDQKGNLYRPDVYRGLLVSLADWYGYGYTTQQEGVIHNNIIPVEEHAETIGHSGNARYELGLHVEDASFNLGLGKDISPDFLTLHFFRNSKLVPTILSIPDWKALPTKTKDILSDEWFYNQTNPLQGGEKNNTGKPVSIVYGPTEDPWVRLNTSRLNIDMYDEDKARALVDFTDHLNEHRELIGARAGEVVIFDNRRVLHGRAPYSADDYPKYDGTDRWQRRLTVSTDKARIQEFEASPRVVDPRELIAKVSTPITT